MRNIPIGLKSKVNYPISENLLDFKPAVRRERYKIQPKDIIRWEGKDYISQGINNKGATVKLTDGVNSFYKSTKNVRVIYHQKSIIFN